MEDTEFGAAPAAAAAGAGRASVARASTATVTGRKASTAASRKASTVDATTLPRASVTWYDESGFGSYTESSCSSTPRGTILKEQGPPSAPPCCLHLQRLAVLRQQAENKPSNTDTAGPLPFFSSSPFTLGPPMGPSAPSETVAAGGVAAEAKEEGAPAVPAGAAPLEGGEAAAAAVAAQGSLWNQGVTPLRSLMETMISEGPPGAPQLQRAAASFTSRSRAPSLTKPKDAYQGKYFGVRGDITMWKIRL